VLTADPEFAREVSDEAFVLEPATGTEAIIRLAPLVL
jgi:hypothetical protein